MVFFLNLLAPFPFWIAYVIGQINLANKNFFQNTGQLFEWYKKYYIIVAPCIVLLQLISAVFLLSSVIKIRIILKKKGL